MEKSLASLMVEIRGRLELFESNLPKRLDAVAISPASKHPFNALCYREALIWRMVELCRAALYNLEQDKLVSGIVLTRAAVETSAALWHLCAKVDAAVKSNAVGGIDEYLLRLVVNTATPLSGTNDAPLPRPIRVREFLDQADKDIEGFSHEYGILCEYAHPNWAGTVLTYSKNEPASLMTEFGQNLRGRDSTKGIGILNLSVALGMFETSYNRLTTLIPAFTQVCGNHLKDELASQPAPK